MNAHVDKYELFRVVTDYEALQDGFWVRIEDLETTIRHDVLDSQFCAWRGSCRSC